MKTDCDDYEALCQKNIAERNAFLKDFFQEIKEDAAEIINLEKKRLNLVEKENKTPAPKRRSIRRSSPGPRVPHITVVKKYNTRSKKQKSDEDSDNDNDEITISSRRSIKVMFPWARPVQRDIDLMKFDTDEEEESSDNSDDSIVTTKRRKVQRQSKSVYDPNNIPSPDEITDRMLAEVAHKATGKVYDPHNGTSCHQCRQKTKDTKTVCRSGECVGVRGQFCGPCLVGRYGEKIIEALKDANWACPPCRGLCNCSICRTRNGQRPTGILAPTAKESGYNSVKDYLIALDGEEEGSP